jgi:hypothetical protein
MKITSENIKGDDCRVAKGVNPEDTLKRIGLSWLSLRESGRIKDCDCKRVIGKLEAIRETAGGFCCKYIFTKVYCHQEIHQFAVWEKNSLTAEIKDYNRFGELLFFDAVKGEFERSKNLAIRGRYDLFNYTEKQPTACDQCEIDYLIQEGFEIEEIGE